jgi:hypothetical protein
VASHPVVQALETAIVDVETSLEASLEQIEASVNLTEAGVKTSFELVEASVESSFKLIESGAEVAHLTLQIRHSFFDRRHVASCSIAPPDGRAQPEGHARRHAVAISPESGVRPLNTADSSPFVAVPCRKKCGHKGPQLRTLPLVGHI